MNKNNQLCSFELVETFKLDLTPLSVKILEKYHIPLLDVVLCFVFPRLEHQEILKLAQEHLSQLETEELNPQ